MDLSSAVRVAGRGAAAFGVVAAGAAVVCSPSGLVRRSALSGMMSRTGWLRGQVREILTPDGTALHVEVDEPEDLVSRDVTIISPRVRPGP